MTHAISPLRIRCERALAAATLLAAIAIGAGCATTSALRAGERAEQAQDYDQAVVEFTKAVKQNPNNRGARQALERAKLRAAQDHLSRGRRLHASGKLDEALVDLQLAAELNPGSADIDDLLRTVRIEQRTKISVAREGKTQLETLIDRSRDMTAPGLELPTDVRLPATLMFRDASSRDVFTAMARFANINVVFDAQFRAQPVTIDLRNAALEDALTAVTQATRSFYKVTGQRTITVIPDTAAKRREYEEEIVRTFYLSNADLRETIDLLRIVIDSRRIAPITATNALSIKDAPERIAAASKLIAAIDKAKPEVVIDVELLEVDRTRLREYGLQLASSSTSSGIDGTLSVNRDDLTLRDVRNLTQAGVSLTNLPSLYYKLLKSDNNTRILANPQLRSSEGATATARFGERVPVPVTTFTQLSSGSDAQPVTSYNYENIGVNIDLKPRTHHNDEVSLELKVEVSNISGTGYNDLPTFGNRSISTVIRLHDGETNLLAGLIRDEERRVVEGVPGLIDIPMVGRIFAHNKLETEETDIVLTLTPHIIRVLDLTEADLLPFRVGGTAAASSVVDVPPAPELPITPPPAQANPQQPAPRQAEPGQAQPDQPQSQPVQPIRPSGQQR